MKKLTSLLTLAAALVAIPAFAADKAEQKEIKGEIVDITCFADHGASGDKHATCGEKCVASGMPVGIKSSDGTVYTIVGEHKPMNKELAPHVGKTLTLRGKVVSKDGINLIENAEIVK